MNDLKVSEKPSKAPTTSKEESAAKNTAPANAHAPVQAEEMTQEQRDLPYRQRLSATIQAHDKARALRIQENQRKQAESKPKPFR